MLARIAWSSTYTYILLLFVAAAFVAFIARPTRRGEAVQRLYGGELIEDFEVEDPAAADGTPRLYVRCLEGGNVEFRRVGVAGLTSTGAVSLAVTVTGKDVEVKERVSPGFVNDRPMAGASFVVDLTGSEWRHVHWVDEDSGYWCAFTLHLRPGISFSVILHQ